MLFIILGLLVVVAVGGIVWWVAQPQSVPSTPENQPEESSEEVSDQPPPEYTDEPGIVLFTEHTTATVSQELEFAWLLNGPEGSTSMHTAIHWGDISHPGSFGSDVAPSQSGYPNLTSDFANGEFAVPELFTTKLSFTKAGTYYYRVHAIVDGQNYWTFEYTLVVE